MIGIVLKEGIKVEVSQKNGEMGSPRITVCRPRGQEKKEKRVLRYLVWFDRVA